MPFVTELEPLLDVLVHSQDICVPLGIEHPMPVDAAVAAANRVLSLRGPMRLWERPQGLRLVASDADWAYGVGAMHEAPMQAPPAHPHRPTALLRVHDGRPLSPPSHRRDRLIALPSLRDRDRRPMR